MPDRAAGRPECVDPWWNGREGEEERESKQESQREEEREKGEADHATTTTTAAPRTPPPWDLSPFTAAEIRGPTLLIYRYLDTYTLAGVVF